MGAILISAAWGVIDLNGLRQIWKISRIEFGFAMIALAGAISFGVLWGVVVAIVATFLYVTLNSLQPRVVLMGRIAQHDGFYKLHRTPEAKPVDGIAICFVQGSVLFFNADHVKARLDDIIDKSPDGLRWFVIDASAITQIDTTAAAMLLDIRTRLRRRGIVMVLAEVQSSVAAFLGRAGLSPQEGDLQFFDDLDDAFHAFEATASMPREGQA